MLAGILTAGWVPIAYAVVASHGQALLAAPIMGIYAVLWLDSLGVWLPGLRDFMRGGM